MASPSPALTVPLVEQGGAALIAGELTSSSAGCVRVVWQAPSPFSASVSHLYKVALGQMPLQPPPLYQPGCPAWGHCPPTLLLSLPMWPLPTPSRLFSFSPALLHPSLVKNLPSALPCIIVICLHVWSPSRTGTIFHLSVLCPSIPSNDTAGASKKYSTDPQSWFQDGFCL